MNNRVPYYDSRPSQTHRAGIGHTFGRCFQGERIRRYFFGLLIQTIDPTLLPFYLYSVNSACPDVLFEHGKIPGQVGAR